MNSPQNSSQLSLGRGSFISLAFREAHFATQTLTGLPLPLRWNSKPLPWPQTLSPIILSWPLLGQLYLTLNSFPTWEVYFALLAFAYAVSISGRAFPREQDSSSFHQLPPQRGLPWLFYLKEHLQPLSRPGPCSHCIALPHFLHGEGSSIGYCLSSSQISWVHYCIPSSQHGGV